MPSISANGPGDGILWTIGPGAQLDAFDAADLSHQLYQGSVSSPVKFATPTIANGKVYVGTLDSVNVFGLQNQASGSVVSVVNAAGFQPGPLAPGSIVSLFGTNLAERATIASAPLAQDSVGLLGLRQRSARAAGVREYPLRSTHRSLTRQQRGEPR